MNLKLTRVDVWAADIDDKPGGLARALRAVASRGSDLDYVIARRQPDKPGKGIVFVSPIQGQDQVENAGAAEFRRTSGMATLRIEGPDRPGVGAKVTDAIADVGVTLNALTATVFGHRFVCYAEFDSVQDLQKAEAALRRLATPRRWPFWHRRAETTTA